MRILLDENIDPSFSHSLSEYSVETVKSMGWRGFKNGKLLAKARDHFEIFITLDRGILFQHNHAGAPLTIIVLRTKDGKLNSLLQLLPQLKLQLDACSPGILIELEQSSNSE